MSVVISVVSQKGGVGKTTLAQNLGYELAANQSKVLLIDFDPQGNLTMGCGLNKYADPTSAPGPTIYNALQGEDILSCVVGLTDRLAIAPANLELSEAEIKFAAAFDRNIKLQQAIAPIRDACDFIIIDGPPSLGFLTANSLMAATHYIIPLQVHPYAYFATQQLMGIIGEATKANENLKLLGVVLTMFDKRNSLSDAIKQLAKDKFNSGVFNSHIPVNVRIPEATLEGVAVSQYEVDSIGASAYRELTKEVLQRV